MRVDDPNAERRPARNVHNDYSRSGAEQRLIDLVGDERAAEYRAGHYGFVNVWRPVEHTIRTSPLGFIRPSSIKPEDWMTIELIYPDRLGQILGVAANEDHEWFYMSEMTPDDVAIFNIYDNRGRPFSRPQRPRYGRKPERSGAKKEHREPYAGSIPMKGA